MNEYTVGVAGREHYVTAEKVNESHYGLEFLDSLYNKVAFFKAYDYFITTGPATAKDEDDGIPF